MVDYITEYRLDKIDPEDTIGLCDADLDHERIVLASMLRSNANIDKAKTLFTHEDFIGGEASFNGSIFTMILKIDFIGRREVCIDVKEVIEGLCLSPLLKTWGGEQSVIQYVGNILEQDPSGAYFDYYAAKAKDKSVRRKIENTIRKNLAEVLDPSMSTDELISMMQHDANGFTVTNLFGKFKPLRRALEEASEEIDRRRTEGLSGVTYGIDKIDFMTDGLQAGEFCLIGARPSVGKTAFGVCLAREAARTGVYVAFFSIEQATRELAFRLLAGESGISSLVMRRGKVREDGPAIRRIQEAHAALAPLPINFNDYGQQTVRSMFAHCRRLNGMLGLVVIDYAQLITPIDKRMPRHEQVAEISRGLKLMARELNIPVVAMAQLNRKQEDRENEEPKLSDLKDSGALEQDADVVILLHRPVKPNPDEPTEIIKAKIAKQRNGPCGSVSLSYRKAAMRFETLQEGIPL